MDDGHAGEDGEIEPSEPEPVNVDETCSGGN